MVTDKQLKKAKEIIGTKKTYTFNNLAVEVKILDVKVHGPFLLYQIAPVHGSGSEWVQKFSKKAK